MSTDTERPLDRRARRKAETRAKLIMAARKVFARQGVEATRINEITDEADVGFGSFYNHFESKDAIVAVVVAEVVGTLGSAIDAATAGVDDPAEVVSVAHRALVLHAQADPELGRLLVRLELIFDVGIVALGGYAARDIERGRREGRFDVDDVPFAVAATGGALLGVVRAALHDPQAVAGLPERHAAGVLRLLGLPAADAAAVAARPLPDDLNI